MTRTSHRAFVNLALLTILVLAIPALGASPDSPYSLEIAVEPYKNLEGGYQCKVVIREGATDEILAAPTLQFLRGDLATTETTLETGERVTLEVTVEKGEPKLSYRMEVRSPSQLLLSRHQATIRLAN